MLKSRDLRWEGRAVAFMTFTAPHQGQVGWIFYTRNLSTHIGKVCRLWY